MDADWLAGLGLMGTAVLVLICYAWGESVAEAARERRQSRRRDRQRREGRDNRAWAKRRKEQEEVWTVCSGCGFPVRKQEAGKYCGRCGWKRGPPEGWNCKCAIEEPLNYGAATSDAEADIGAVKVDTEVESK